jgi:hypothetical protein
MAATDSSPVGTRRWPIWPVAASLVLLVGCGGQSVALTSGIPDAAGSGSASTVAGAVSGGPSPFVGTTPGVGPTIAPGPTVAPGPAVGTSAFCRDLTDQLSILPNLLGRLGSPDQRDAVLQQIRAASAKLVRDAPAAVRPDVLVLAALYNRIIADVSATPPNLNDVSQAFTEPAYQAASANVGRYAGQHCGSIAPLPDTPPTS